MALETWRPVLSRPAEQDFIAIIRWTAENFGARQASAYRDLILQSLLKLRRGPDVIGARSRDELGPGLFALNVGRRGKPGRHLLLYRPQSGQIIEILRVLHQSMDLELYVSPDAAAKSEFELNR